MQSNYIYKIWDNVNQKYHSTGKKGMWKSSAWAINAAKDAGDWHGPDGEKVSRAERYHIHKIKLVVEESYSLKELLVVNTDLGNQIKELDEQLRAKLYELSHVLGTNSPIPIATLDEMVMNNLLSKEAEHKIDHIKTEISELQFTIGLKRDSLKTI